MLILSLSVFACSDDNDENGLPDVDLSEFPIQGFLDWDTSFMLIAVEEDSDGFFAYMRLLITENHDVLSLQINGNNIQISASEGFYNAGLDLVPGQEFTYRLRIDDNIRTGKLAVPEPIRGTFPQSFNLSANYTMSWTTPSDPAGYVALLQIGLDLDDDWLDHGQLLQGSARSHTFSSSIYSGLGEDDVWYIDAGVLGMNFDINDDMLIMAAFDEYEVYDFDDEIGFRQAEKKVAGDRPRGRFPATLRHQAVPVE
ncbi:MAG: hypothetical protein EA363_03330 [Balneolaceae bacterium]|nr:MAG: hypothetical protein EA363_03330 [Balneolaceae bacterium]